MTTAMPLEWPQECPLVIPESYPEDVLWHEGIANPNCSTTQMLVVLSPYMTNNVIKKIVVSTYQAVSGSGTGIAELERQLRAYLERTGA